METRRPDPASRCFASSAVDAAIARVGARIADPELAWLFGNCLPNTLDTTVRFCDGDEPDTFVITGDIAAMWLRDSTAQVWPSLQFVREDARLARMLRRTDEGPYRFQRRGFDPLDTLPFAGAGWPARPNGLIRSAFSRPGHAGADRCSAS